MPKIYDIVCYNGERELFEIRYNVLKPYVDEFIVVEFDKTFSGKPRNNYFNNVYEKTRHYFNPESLYGKYKELAENSPNTKGAEHWKTEFMQKESIKDRLNDLQDDDIVFIGDCDEIWEAEFALKWCHAPFRYKLKVYTYYLNNRSNEEFWGILVSPYKHIKNACLNHLRTSAWKTNFYAGWHFTSMHHQLERKLKDSYTEEDYARPRVLNDLQDNIKNDKDFLGRNFTYKVDESQWPEWLKEHRQDYLHLLK